MKVELISKTVPTIEGINTEDIIAYVARIGKIKDNPAKLIKYLIRNKHWSPFTHVYFGFKIETSRAIGRQMLRHSSLSMQEWSQRYEEEIMGFEPIEIRKKATKNRQSSEDVFDPIIKLDVYGVDGYINIEASNAIDMLQDHIKAVYKGLIEAGVASECARFILPECTKSTLIFTGNVRSWIHFLELRLDEHTQKEARLIAKQIEAILVKEIPSVFEALKNN